MITERQFTEWRDGLPPEKQAFIDRLTHTNRAAAYALYPVPEGPPDRAICTHEAGHAAAMHAFGISIEFAFAKDTHGAVQPAKRIPGQPVNYAAHGVVLLAGDMAETYPPLSRKQWLDTISGVRMDAESDEREAIVFASALANSPDAIMANILQFWNIAVDMFGSPGFWPAVFAVSDILRRDGRIDGEQVHALCEQHLPFGSLIHLTKEN